MLRQKGVNGVEMGVLENGMPFLTQSGLARIAGTSRSVIYDITQEWAEHFEDEVLGKGRFAWLRQYLGERGYNEPQMYIATKRAGQAHHAYPDIVCMAVIECYAFEAQIKNQAAIDRRRISSADSRRPRRSPRCISPGRLRRSSRCRPPWFRAGSNGRG